MSHNDTEFLLYGGESPRNSTAFRLYLQDVARGKSLLQLQAVAGSITPLTRQSWSARSFTPIQTSSGTFDEIVYNIPYHFHKHGQKYGTVQRMTDEALRYFHAHRTQAKVRKTDGLLVPPNHNIYEQCGKIVTFVG